MSSLLLPWVRRDYEMPWYRTIYQQDTILPWILKCNLKWFTFTTIMLCVSYRFTTPSFILALMATPTSVSILGLISKWRYPKSIASLTDWVVDPASSYSRIQEENLNFTKRKNCKPFIIMVTIVLRMVTWKTYETI